MNASDTRTILIMGSSTGGPRTLEQVFFRFPVVRAAIIVVQHMPAYINETICGRLQRICNMEIVIARDGDEIRHGRIYIAPSGSHLKIVDNRTICLFDDEKVHAVRPSIDVAMQSLAGRNGDTLAGVILTGMGTDGAEGIRHIKNIGGTTIAQDIKTSIVHSMPKAAFETGMVDFVLPPEGIRSKIFEIAGLA
ncbi:MAG: chemotaxis protein CheB [Methanomicrobiaceae archaeon]|nr:chemotaxis protein CheB [Methanomicrobiaceae archaeon]MDD5419315.1 CheB methylesterase domain-containing protein [Methanomicrobiaceae archaeon]